MIKLMNQKGFATVFVLIGVIILVAVLGGVYYFGTQKNNPPIPSPKVVPDPVPKATTPNFQNTPSVNLSIKSESNKIIFLANTSGNVYMPKSYYFYPTGSWAIYRFVNNEWVKITPSRSCITSCDAICETGPISCVAGGPSPTCQLASSEEIFEWEKQYVDYKKEVCGTITHECAYRKEAEPGRYKVTFMYKSSCNEDQLFEDNLENNSSVTEKEFTI